MKVHEKVKRTFLTILCVPQCMCTICVQELSGHKESDPPELELQRDVSLCVGAGNWEQ